MSSFTLKILLFLVLTSIINASTSNETNHQSHQQHKPPKPPSYQQCERCAILDKPIKGKPCRIQNNIYVMEQQMNTHLGFIEYRATSKALGSHRSDKKWVVLEWFSLNQPTSLNATQPMKIVSERIMSMFNITNAEQHVLKWKHLHLIEYYDHSLYEQGDKSLILVRKFCEGGNVIEFNRNIMWKTKQLSRWFREVFAIHGWCEFLRQISIPLKFFQFTRVDLQDIFVDVFQVPSHKDVEKETKFYKYVIGRFERQDLNEKCETNEIISALVMAAWKYYSIFAETEIIVDGNGNKLKQRRDINHFAVQSKQFWRNAFDEISGDSTEGESELRMAGAAAQNALILSIIGGKKNPELWKDTMELQIAAFTSQFTFPSNLAQNAQDWYQFDTYWNKICHEWIYPELGSNVILSALEKYELLTDKPKGTMSDVTSNNETRSSPAMSTPTMTTPQMERSDTSKSSMKTAKSSLKSGSSKSNKTLGDWTSRRRPRDVVITYDAAESDEDNDPSDDSVYHDDEDIDDIEVHV